MRDSNEPFEIAKEKLVSILESCKGKTLGQVDKNNVFAKTVINPKITGIAGDVIEKSVIGYPADSKQRPDLSVSGIETELKTTGLIKNKDKKLTPKEPVSITAVSLDKIASQTFDTSFFWHKIAHLLFVYYLYVRKNGEKVVPASGYADFPILDYQFYEFNETDKAVLKNDWEIVRNLIADLQSKYSAEELEKYYPLIHSTVKKDLMFIDIAPRFPNNPRFRFKKDLIEKIIDEKFGKHLEELPVRYSKYSEIDSKCHQLASTFAGKSIEEIIELLHLEKPKKVNKALAETIIIRMFDGKSKNFIDVELFRSIGLICKTIIMNKKGGKTEDTKMFKIDFDEFNEENKVDYEDSSIYDYFINHQFLFMCLEEPYKDAPLLECKFLGFKRVLLDTEQIASSALRTWKRIKFLIENNLVENVPVLGKDGKQRITPKTGVPMFAPNFPKSTEDIVFVRGSGTDASKKPVCLNGVEMYAQYIWILGSFLVYYLSKFPYL